MLQATVYIYVDTLDYIQGTSLVVQWLRFHAPNAGGPGLIPGQGTRPHIPQLRACMPQLKIPHAATKKKKILHAVTKTQHRQKKKKKKTISKK